MAENLSVGGLASGLDTTSLINGLLQLERNKVTRAEEKKTSYEVKLDKFTELSTKLQEFADLAKGMDKLTAFNLFKSVSSNDSLATIEGDTDATSGNYDVKVLGLANSQKVASGSFASQLGALGLSGSFNLSTTEDYQKNSPLETSVQIDISSTDSLKDIVGKINRAKGSGATASIVNMGNNDYRLMLTATQEGTKAFTMDAVGGSTILSGTGLDLVSGNESIRTDFNFRLAAGGAASTTTALVGNELFYGLGTGHSATAGDTISWTATDANGNSQDGSLVLGGASTMQDLLDAVKAEFDDGGDQVDVSLNESGEIVITDKTGGTSPFTLSMSFTDGDASGSTLGLGSSKRKTEFANVISNGKNAFYLLNDISVASQSNTDKTTVVGTKINLKRVDASETVKLTLNRDHNQVLEKVREFVVGYNTVIKYLNEQSKVEVKDKKEQSALDQLKQTNASEKVTRGAFAGDSSILGLKQQLQNLVTGRMAELTAQGLSKFDSMAAIGITTLRNDGTLDIDEEEFKEALDVDFEGVRRMFITFGYSDTAGAEYGTATKDTRTGVYAFNTGTNQIDGNRTAAGISYLTGTLSGDNNILNSESGDSKGLGLKFTGSQTGSITFVRGIAGQVQQWHKQINDFVNGFSTETKKSLRNRIQDETKRIERLESQVEKYRQRLVSQFSNLELSISRLQSQSAAFSSSGVGALRR
jgi:flagellar hook-associated protein 2